MAIAKTAARGTATSSEETEGSDKGDRQEAPGTGIEKWIYNKFFISNNNGGFIKFANFVRLSAQKHRPISVFQGVQQS